MAWTERTDIQNTDSDEKNQGTDYQDGNKWTILGNKWTH